MVEKLKVHSLSIDGCLNFKCQVIKDKQLKTTTIGGCVHVSSRNWQDRNEKKKVLCNLA